MTENLNCFSDDKELERLANIDLSLLDKLNEEKQLDDSEISSFTEIIETATQQKRRKLTSLNAHSTK